MLKEPHNQAVACFPSRVSIPSPLEVKDYSRLLLIAIDPDYHSTWLPNSLLMLAACDDAVLWLTPVAAAVEA